MGAWLYDWVMTKLVYTESELFAEHDYAAPHIVDGVRMHGGFGADGKYQPPRALIREEALAHWASALNERGGTLMDADASLLSGIRLPNTAQYRVLLRHGLGETFWNSLTITGKIEAKGRILAEMEFPHLQPFIIEDISEMAIGHLNAGLLKAHGIDEGGDPQATGPDHVDAVGAHDVMWFVARDLAFGRNAFPDVEPPERIARDEDGQRWLAEVHPALEGVVSFLMNLLMIEFRAEIGFATTQEVLRTPELFTDRRELAEEAADLVGRIRTDEEIHVRSLRLYLGELRSVTFKTTDGGSVSGALVIDRFWEGLVRWATVEQPPLAAAQQMELIEARIRQHADGEAILAEFLAASEFVTA